MENIIEKIKYFISEHFGIEEESIKESARIEEDLKISGDDATDLILAYSARFNVDVTKFIATKYFEGESNLFYSKIYRLMTGRQKRRNKSLTIGHLIKGIEFGRLDEEIINSI